MNGNETKKNEGKNGPEEEMGEKSFSLSGNGWVTLAIGLGGAAFGILMAGLGIYGFFRCYRRIKDGLRTPVHRIHDDILLLKNRVSFLNAELTSQEGRRGLELWELRNTIERSSMRVQAGLERLERGQEREEEEKMMHSSSSILKTERKELHKFATIGGRGSKKGSRNGDWSGSLDRKDVVSSSSFKPVQRGGRSSRLNECGGAKPKGSVYLAARVSDFTHHPGDVDVERSFSRLPEENPDAIYVEADYEEA